MHTIDLDLSLDEVTKVEGAARLEIKIRKGKVEKCTFGITEYKRFYTQAMQGKLYKSLPQLLMRICGTCSNAHLLASIESCEKALGYEVSPQTKILKNLTVDGLLIRDHALHLYLFALPDMYGKDNFLAFDEHDKEQHQHLHDAFAIKAAGNYLAQVVAGRSVHAINPVIGGFLKVPTQEEVDEAIRSLVEIRPAVRRLIHTFARCDWHFDRRTNYMALVSNPYGYLEGEIKDDNGNAIPEDKYRDHLERVVLPYSQASGYTYQGESFMVGALARMNLSKDTLHPDTKKDAADALERFPSTNIFDNNLAQAIEILNAMDTAEDMLRNTRFKVEKPAEPTKKEGTGVGVVEAPRGTLYHRVEIGADGKVTQGTIVVPTGQNQINIEQDLATLAQQLIDAGKNKEEIQFEMEKLIRAYDPCMSCASHFLRVNWS